jgi:hypothetical protein
MLPVMQLARSVICVVALAGCRTPHGLVDADLGDGARPDAPVDKSIGCVATFGQDLTNGFGRLDGTLVAVVPPTNTSCPAVNSTHLVLEIRANGNVYRIVAAVSSTIGNPVMALAERDATLEGPVWTEGWNLGIAFDFVNTLGLHRLDFTPTPEPQLIAAITAKLVIGAKVSVFGTVENEPDSAHLIHRNAPDEDGGIIINPDNSPHYMLMRFDNQLF